MNKTSLIRTLIDGPMVLASTFGLLAASAGVAEAAPCLQNHCVQTAIGELRPNETGIVLVEPADGGQSDLNCTTSTGNRPYVHIDLREPGGDAMYRMLLSAKIAGLPATLRIEPNSHQCRLIYVSMD